jgi:drug/metabolite transporter (DMT)-like permease
LKNVGGLSRRQLIWGISLGALAMATTAVGIVIIKPLLNRSPLLWVLEVRLLGGILGLLPVLWFHPQRKGILSTLQHQRSWTYTLAGSFLGTYISLLLWLAGMKYTQTSIAAALNQTSNIFVFIFAGIFLKEIIDWKRILAISLGIAGSFMVFFG